MSTLTQRFAELTDEQRAFLKARLKEQVERARRQITPLERSEGATYPLSFAQERLWFIYQLDRQSPLYNVPAAVRLRGKLDHAALERSLNEIVRRHEVLRTNFVTVEGQPAQRINPYRQFALPVADLSEYAADQTEVYARLQATATMPFDLTSDALYRAQLFRLGQDDHILLVVLHHIVSDGISVGLFLGELWQYYSAYAQGNSLTLPDFGVQYADFAAWQRSWLQGETLDAQLTYWKAQLGDGVPNLDLPTDRPRPAVQTFDGAHYPLHLPAKLSAALEKLSRDEGVTFYITLLTAYKVLLHRYTGQETIVVGSPVANRTRPEVEPLVGFFVNNLVLKSELSGNPTFRELLRQMQTTAFDAYAHQDLPFERLVEMLQVPRDLSRSALFQVAFALQENPAGNRAPYGLELELLELHSPISKFDLTLELFKLGDGVRGWFEYNTALFDRATVARLAGNFEALLESIVAQPDVAIGKLNLLTATEWQALAHWNSTARTYPATMCAHQIFEGQVAATPNAPAVRHEDGTVLSYAELNSRANRLANYLRKSGVAPDAPVAIYAERTPLMVTAILATMKAGGAYLPLDPNYPAERLRYMLENSGAKILLTSEVLQDDLPDVPENVRVICMDDSATTAQIANYSDANLPLVTNARNLAYIIYTSGSTGQPKGVMLEHRGLVNLGFAQRAAFGVGAGDNVLQFASLSFDASVWEIFMALLNGAAICLCDGEKLRMGGAVVAEILDAMQISIATLPPSLVATMPFTPLPALKTLVVAGESCSEEIVRRWQPGRRFVNAYGPTETTVCATMQECDANIAGKPSIGKPLPNFSVYILDNHGSLLPAGVPGEMYVGGPALARGYLNRPDLTNQKFVPDPFSADPDARLYRTGDLARYLPGGEIEFLGRIDSQVKLRGFRIELEEIEAVLRQHPAVLETVVIVRDERLVGYIVPQADAAPTFGELRNFLKKRLPDYMTPAAFVTLAKLPYTPNGKIDKKMLPAPEARPVAPTVREQVLPGSELERTIAGVWQEALKLETVSTHDNFFDIGGYSLLMVKIHEKLQTMLEREIPIISLFKFPTISSLSEHLQETATGSEAATRQVEQTIRQTQDRAGRQREAALAARQRMQQPKGGRR
jgi:amino acid adenylation domain-containing protein